MNIFERIKLFDNKRIENHDQSFKQWLLDIADGILENQIEEEHEVINIPNDMQCHSDIIHGIFGQSDFEVDDESINKKVFLTTYNSDILALNKQVLKKLKGDRKASLAC